MTNEPIVIATQASGSGLGRFAVELANALAAAGHPVTMVAPVQPYPLSAARSITIATPTARGGWRRLLQLIHQSLAIARAVLREAGPGRPVLLIHLAPTLPVSLAPLLAVRLKGAAVVLGLHDFYPHTAHFPRSLQGVERWLYRAAYRRCTLIVTNNATHSRRLITEARIPAARVRTLFHGPFVISGLVPSGPQDELRLLLFGSLRPNKQIFESIWAIRQLRLAGTPVSLRIAGAVRREDAAYWARCRAVIPLGDPGFDVQPRYIADDQLAAVLSGVDAMLCPYAEFDSQSGVAVTGVSNALPVIATAAAHVAHVDLAAAPWPAVGSDADAPAIAAAILGFMAVPTPIRQAFAVQRQQQFLATAGWDTLAAGYGQAMRELRLWP